MADPWEPSTAYPPGSVVSYNGLIYIRSQYPATATTGTPPNQEMSVDDKETPIRTWTIKDDEYAVYHPKFATKYFRLIEPPLSSTDGLPEFQYSGEQFNEGNAYAPIGDGVNTYGLTVEIDQAKNNTPPTPDAPVCPAESCGVAMQQFSEDNGIVFCGAADSGDASNPRKYYIFVLFNHPLYFRRTITVVTQIRRVITVNDPFSQEVTYLNSYTAYVPDDRNYVSVFLNSDYFVPANAAFEVIVPEDESSPEGSTVYTFSARGVQEVTPND